MGANTAGSKIGVRRARFFVFIDDATSSQIKILNGGYRLDVATTCSLPDLLASLECLHFLGTHGDLFFRWWDGWIYLCHCGA